MSRRGEAFSGQTGAAAADRGAVHPAQDEYRPGERLARLTVGKQQMVEIAKAMSHELRILILDEPTAALADAEIEELFAIMRDLARHGVGMVHISHRLDEIHRIADRVTVLRDGERVDTQRTAEVTRQQIINMMVGRVIYEQPKTSSSVARRGAPVVLRVNRLKAGRLVRDVSFELRQGEILGIAGLIGSGRTETVRAIFGADEVESGTVEVSGRRVAIRSPRTPWRTASATSPRTGSATGWPSTSA